MRRVFIIGLLLLLVMAKGAVAYTWPQGWSLPIADLGHSRAGYDYLMVMENGKVYTLEIDETARVLHLVTIDLETKSRLGEVEIARIEGQVRGMDMAIGEDGVLDIVWIENRTNLHAVLHVSTDVSTGVVSEIRELYSSDRPMRQVVVASGGDDRVVVWGELQQRFTMMRCNLSEPAPQALMPGEIPKLPLQVLADTEEGIHLLWFHDDPSSNRRMLYYSRFNSSFQEQQRHELGNLGINERLNSRMVIEGETLYIIWSQYVPVPQTLFILPGLNIGYAEFVDGKPVSGPLVLEGSDFWRMERPDFFVTDGAIELVWATNLDDNTEVFHGRIIDNTITDITRLTWATHYYTNPRIFRWHGYSYVYFQQITGDSRILNLIENKNPEIPGISHRLGIDKDNILASAIFKLGWVIGVSAAATILGVFPIGLSTLILFFIHKKVGGFPRTGLGFMFSLILVCVLMFVLVPVNPTLNMTLRYNMSDFVALGQAYQLYLFLLVSLSTVPLFYFFGRGSRDEPLLYAKAAFVWHFLWCFLAGATLIPFVIA